MVDWPSQIGSCLSSTVRRAGQVAGCCRGSKSLALAQSSQPLLWSVAKLPVCRYTDTCLLLDLMWHAAWTVSPPVGMYNLQNRRMAPIQARHVRKALNVTSPATDTYIFDMGYNAAGTCTFKVDAAIPANTTLHVLHGEALDANGNLIPSPTTEARRDKGPTGRTVEISAYIVAGDGSEEVYQPEFVYYGFRYVQVITPVAPMLSDMGCVDVSTDLATAGTVTFADGAVNEVCRCSSALNRRIDPPM